MTEINEEELKKRQAYISNLKTFLAEQQEKISLTLETLGWSPEHFIKPQNKAVCPFDRNHVIPEDKFEKHKEKCELKSKGVPNYLLGEVIDEEKRIKKTSVNTVKLDEAELNSILWNRAVDCGQVYTGQRKLPTTHEDEKVILSPQERLAIHEHIVSEAKSLGLMLNVDKDENLTTDWEKIIKKGVLKGEGDDDSLSLVQKLAAIRDFKRRRQSYRAKNVHTTRKSYTEIIQEVISNQMEMWGAEIKGETLEGKGEGKGVIDEARDRGRGDSDRYCYSDRGREGGRDSDSGREVVRDSDTGREVVRDSDRGRDTYRSHYKDYGRDRERIRDRSRSRERDRSRRNQPRDQENKKRDRSGDREGSKRERSGDRVGSKRDRSMDREGSKRDRSMDRERDRSGDRESSKRDRASSKRDRSRERERGKKSKKKLKERRRSRSEERYESKNRRRNRSDSGSETSDNRLEERETTSVYQPVTDEPGDSRDVQEKDRIKEEIKDEEKTEEIFSDRSIKTEKSKESSRHHHSHHKKSKKHKHKHKYRRGRTSSSSYDSNHTPDST
ncbi:U11/U12 small nuclear ribonucleoprotein 48 kDa protein [Patella vulgata]|uniref:U11/U12 small nuclear ribonucleoprotein 48 kDa protein n=1 Tax=Patella vulgata TaxID=6465 RepID=UPI00217F4100|nr:U11/U12 small nuclear ribonucleoprotein 48 kDa protein [Patella vulgata]